MTKNFDGWAKMSDGWANTLPCPPLATPMIGEDWVWEREPRNEHDRYAVAIEVIVNHWPFTSKDLTIVPVVSEEGE